VNASASAGKRALQASLRRVHLPLASAAGG
jgi:hypothetical protein